MQLSLLQQWQLFDLLDPADLTNIYSWPLSQCSSIVKYTMLVIISFWNHFSLSKGQNLKSRNKPPLEYVRLCRLPFILFNLLLTKSSFKLQVSRQLLQRVNETMPSVSHFFFQWLKGHPIMSNMFENKPAEIMSFMSFQKRNFLIKCY